MSFDAFACYNSKTTEEVASVCEYIRNHHLQVFRDADHILPGRRHDQIIDDAIKTSETILVFVGPEGLGPWQSEELLSAHWDSVAKSQKVLMPVLLPGAAIDHPEVPGFLRARSSVGFRRSVNEPDVLIRIIEGILGHKVVGQYGDLEKPVTQQEFDSLLDRTIGQYDTPLMAEQFYEVWRQNIPLEKIAMLERHLSRGAKVLDAGCGPGHHSHHLARRGFDVTGIDLSDSSLAIAHKTITADSHPRFVKADMRYARVFDRHSFDAVWACGSCVHTPDAFLDRQLREFLRVLRPGGYLGITLQVARLPSVEADGRFFEGYRDQHEVLRYLELARFRVVDVNSDVTGKNTHNIKNVVNWVAVVAQAPDKPTYVSRAAP